MVARSTFSVLLLAAFAAAGPAPLPLPVNNDLEDQVAELGPDQKDALSSVLDEMGKSGGKPLIHTTVVETALAQGQELEEVAGEGKQFTELRTSLPKDCGRSPRYERSNGQRGNAPWLILMGKGKGKDFELGCVGVVISSRHVIANALCVIANEVNTVVAPTANDVKLIQVLGISTVPDAQKAEDLVTGKNIALVTLKTPLTFSEFIQPACLPDLLTTANLQGRISNATVFGVVNNNGDLEKFAATVDAYGSAVFYSFLKKYNSDNPREQVKSIELVSTNHLGVLANYKPLRVSALFLRNEEEGRMYVVGVGPVASNPEEPVVLYTSVVPYRHWIEVIVRQ